MKHHLSIKLLLVNGKTNPAASFLSKELMMKKNIMLPLKKKENWWL